MNHHYNTSYAEAQPQFPIIPPLFTYCEENLDFDFSSLFDDDKELFVTPNVFQNSNINMSMNIQHGYSVSQPMQLPAQSAYQQSLQSTLGSGSTTYPSHQDLSDDGNHPNSLKFILRNIKITLFFSFSRI